MRDDIALSKIVNQSGFPLQLAVDDLIQRTGEEIGWSVLYREHGWSNTDGQSGFADIVLEDRFSSSVVVIECKRVLDCDWLFLEESGARGDTRKSRVWVSNTPNHGVAYSSYFDVVADPPSKASMYCVVAGQDQKSRPLLERVAAEVCSSVEAIAREEWDTMLSTGHGFRMYIPLVLTTARLMVSAIDTSSISLESGAAEKITHHEVPYVRFRKQLSSAFALPPVDQDLSFSSLALAREKMVYVVNASHFEEFLRGWKVQSSSFLPLMGYRLQIE